MTEKKIHLCPICKAELSFNERYPNYVCESCISRASSLSGRLLSFSNVDATGGFTAEYQDDNSQYKSNVCYIDKIKCFANEARFGGIVVEVLPPQKVLYVDMDGVLADFKSTLALQSPEILKEYVGREDEIPDLFSQMKPIEGAVEHFNALSEIYDIYILSTAPWGNHTAWSDKLNWVKRHLGESAYKRLILTHHKNLNNGDYLIDDRDKNGAGEFKGELLLFGENKPFPNWKSIYSYLTEGVTGLSSQLVRSHFRSWE